MKIIFQRNSINGFYDCSRKELSPQEWSIITFFENTSYSDNTVINFLKQSQNDEAEWNDLFYLRKIDGKVFIGCVPDPESEIYYYPSPYEFKTEAQYVLKALYNWEILKKKQVINIAIETEKEEIKVY